MRSLFARILLWFAGAMVITVLATSVTSIVSYKQNSTLHAPFSLLIRLEAAEAQHAWETGGREELAATLARFRGVTRAYGVYFTDAAGLDLATGRTQRKLIETARRHPSFPFRETGGVAFAHFSADGRYCFFLVISPARLFLSNLQPAHLLVIVIAVGLCYALAYNLLSPLRSLQKAMEKFGRGDLKARAPEQRRDEVGELARSFNHMAERIQTLLSAQHRLLLDISHELRSPLARLSVAIELARSGELGPVPLGRIQKEADRLNDLIGQMLQVARLENNPAYGKIEPVRLDELVDALVDDCAIEARAHGCLLALETPIRVSIAGDRELLRRAIENVLRNAIRYAPPQSKVEIAVENGGGRARVRVRDYGPGVPEASLGQLFDPFYRVEVDRNRAGGGAGLGLSIARRAVELHRGTLRASNAAPGLLVEIELPV